MFAARRVPDPTTEPTTQQALERGKTDPQEISVHGASATAPAGGTDWPELVARIRGGDKSGLEDLYRVFSKGIRFYLCRQLGPQELDDRVHDAFLIVVQAIQRGELREPERLMGFVRTVVRRQVAAHIDQAVHSRKEEVDLEIGSRVADFRHNPERSASDRQRAELMAGVLRSLSEKDREILTRFYLHEQSQEQICQEMSLSETQFRLLKSRAKARFGELGQKRLQGGSLRKFILRTSTPVPH
jgi:RNA polymerase sigma-70 factor (ECF subfamily)